MRHLGVIEDLLLTLKVGCHKSERVKVLNVAAINH